MVTSPAHAAVAATIAPTAPQMILFALIFGFASSHNTNILASRPEVLQIRREREHMSLRFTVPAQKLAAKSGSVLKSRRSRCNPIP